MYNKAKKYNAVIIGSGVSGLYAALKISEKTDGKLLIVTKSPFGESNSRYAQGGISCVMKSNEADSVELYSDDTLKSGAGLSDEMVVKSVAEKSEEVINNLLEYGVNFDKNNDGSFAYAKGGAHSANRILHSGEDATGMEMIEALKTAVKNSEKIDIAERAMAVQLLVFDNKCRGVIIYNKSTGDYETIFSPCVIIAAGGAGQVYKYTTNPYGATGDGIALGYLAGAEIQDMEFVQFHPTAFVPDSKTRNRYLISEAVRGEGAKLINHRNERFMSKYSDKEELASRDVVTRAIFEEMKKNGEANVFLDTTLIPTEILNKRFPSISKKCLANGFDITKTPIPIAPAAHYTIGGIRADLSGKTSIDGLYAVGESACTGFHGANRLASNSLLECAVSAYELSQNSFKEEECLITPEIQAVIDEYENPTEESNCDINLLKDKLRSTMWENVGIIRNKESLLKAKDDIKKLREEFGRERKCFNMSEYELRNMLTAAFLITECALKREESRGAHFRNDFPKQTEKPEHTVIKK